MKSLLVPESVFDEVVSSASEYADSVEFIPYGEADNSVSGAERAEGIFRWIAGKRFSNLVGQLPNIHWLHTASAGVDHVLTPTVLGREGIIVSDSGPAFGPAISEFVLASMLSVVRSLPLIAKNQNEHRWEQVQQQELAGATIGIVGLGPIGLAIAKRAKAFDMTTLGLRRTLAPAIDVDQVLVGPDGLKTLLQQSDFLVLAAALTDETRQLIGAQELALMKPSARLINIARGGLVDEVALTLALQSGTIGGAMLDVFQQEPLPVSSPLWNLPNVIVSPHHSGGGTSGLRKRQIAIFVENARKYVNNQPLDNVVNISLGY